jgi:(S)-ureidoglycine aminohydrolase
LKVEPLQNPESLLSSLQKGGLSIPSPVLKDANFRSSLHQNTAQALSRYIVSVEAGGKTLVPFVEAPGVETFLFVMDGNSELQVRVGDITEKLKAVGYAFAPPDTGIKFENTSSESVHVLLFKQRYVPLGNVKPWIAFGDINKIGENIYDEMDNVFLRDLLPNDLEFDMNMHTLKFMPDGCHPFVENHVQEHGAYLLVGEEWLSVQKEDFIWFGLFTQQAAYTTGLEPLWHIYSRYKPRCKYLTPNFISNFF